MYLKKLEIVGFKSFADRTKVKFDQGVTAIVGPNGSGKSNIVEALRWVLGEQSAKSLRGSKMPDIIFAGTQKRKAVNYAEVIATFDNSDQYLKTDGQDSGDEVTISRRLYRSGDSDFLINGKKCRLKDIHELFTDTGLGRDSLSIISQGRIESVFNSKAEERRAIFEEAAGVLKYKGRKHETEDKLTGTQDNLDRLEDIIYELNGQIVPLQAQRDTALKFQELDAERASLDLSVLLAQILSEKAKYESNKLALGSVLNEIQTLKASQVGYEKELARLRQGRTQIEKEQEDLQAELLELTRLKSEIQSKISLFDAQKSSSEKSNQERAARYQELLDREKSLQNQRTENQAKVDEGRKLKTALDEQINSLEQELENFSDSPETLMEKLRQNYIKLVNQEADLSNQMTKNKSELENIMRQSAQNDENQKERQDKFEQISSELTKAKSQFEQIKSEVERLIKDFKAQEKEEQALLIKEQNAQKQMFGQMDELKNKKARLLSLENIRDSHSNLFQGVRAVLQASQQISGIVGVVADLISFESQYTTAIDLALGGGSQNIVVEDESAAKRGISYLREKRLGRATFLPLTTIKLREFSQYGRISSMAGFIDTAVNLVKFDERYYNAISNLLGSTVIVDNAENATAIARQMNYNVRIVTLDGTQINPGGSYSGGAGKRNNTTFTTAEIENLQKEISAQELNLKALEKNVQAFTSARKLLTEQLAQLKIQGEEKRLLEKELEMKTSQLQSSQSDLADLLQINQDKAEGNYLSDLRAGNQKIEFQLHHLAEEKLKIDREIEQIKSHSQSFNQLKADKTAKLTDAKLERSEINSDFRYLTTEQNRLSQELARLEQEKSELEQVQLSKEGLTKEQRQLLVSQLQDLDKKLEQSNVRMVSMKFEREDLDAQLEDLEVHNQDYIEQNQNLNMQKTRLEMQNEQSEKYLMDKQSILSSQYAMSFDEASQKAEQLDNLPAAEQKLKQMERQIRALGPINLDAIIQFDEVNNRYQFLSSQKDDLLAAKNMLLTNLNEMDDEVRVRFKSTFDAVKESFQETFSQMFGGGYAQLELTSDDLLNAGVEINVQPPGKKLASLNLMSGGEKALTALALIFAILRVRTVPFVVLDEVEAALDEANVKRFGDYMNHFDNSNQFIVVTHRRGTMAAAAAIYGVTMADAGVSKMISVRLEDYS